MRILFLGDIVGRTGRDAVFRHLPTLRDRYAPAFVIANAENAAGGYGVTEKIAAELLAAGIDCLTLGNHVWDQRDMIAAIDRLSYVLRPLNLPEGTPGRGAALFGAAGGGRVLVINVLARLFMDPGDDPFAAVDRVLRQHPIGTGVAAAIIDFHGEATSEKMAMGHFVDGRASLVVGTHSHVPTADHQVLARGTGYLSDAGMCGDYDSVIGMKKELSVARFVRRMPTERMTPAEGEATVCGLLLDTDPDTGLARRVAPMRIGGRLDPALP